MQSYFLSLIKSICTQEIIAKCAASALLISAHFLFDQAMYQAMLSLLILIVFDYITAMYVVVKTKKPITSKQTFRTPYKIVIYFVLIAAGNLAENSLPTILDFIDETITAFLVLTELISVIENAGKLGYPVPKRLLNKLHELQAEK